MNKNINLDGTLEAGFGEGLPVPIGFSLDTILAGQYNRAEPVGARIVDKVLPRFVKRVVA